MDKFTDDEIRYVIGHEIGHVKHGHTKKRMQGELRMQALQKAGAAAGGTVGQLSQSELGGLAWLQTHPSPKARSKRLKKQISK